MSGITDAAAAVFLGGASALVGLVMFMLSNDGTTGSAVAMWLFTVGLSTVALGPVWFLVARPLVRRVRSSETEIEIE
jgi:hypothetical protein